MNMALSLMERALSYNNTFKKFSTQAPLMATERWLYGVWIIGNDYRNKTTYYGAYPPSILTRLYSLFPDIEENSDILHLFSGSLSENERGDRFDINPDTNPTICGDAEHLFQYVEKKYKLIVADPPYSNEDAEHYGTPLVNRNKVIIECNKSLEIGGFLVWLDQVLPMYRKAEMQLVGTIGIIRSTNHRVRCLFIWQKISEYKIKNE